MDSAMISEFDQRVAEKLEMVSGLLTHIDLVLEFQSKKKEPRRLKKRRRRRRRRRKKSKSSSNALNTFQGERSIPSL